MNPGVPLTVADRDLLTFISEQRFGLPAQAQALLGCSADETRSRLRALTDAGYLIEEPLLARQPVTYRMSRLGLDAIGSQLRRRPIALKNYWHDVGTAWLWLAARNGAFGAMREVLAERVIRSRDAREINPTPLNGPYGVRLGGMGRDGRERLHYPDLLLIARDGHRTAIELEITSKPPLRRDRILAGYAADVRIAKVVYVVYEPQVARAVSLSVSRLGIPSLVAIQRVRQAGGAPDPPAASHDREAGRSASRRTHMTRPGYGQLKELSR